MLPSTGAARLPKAIEVMAAAVYGPIPGNSSNAASVSGNLPAKCSLTWQAQAWRLRARL